jgi:Asp-tRNA(Asn)/Glu-tRNA(Gln) amidotransferase A subunit family amidase
MNEPCLLTATEAARLIRDGSLTCEALVRSCLDRIAARDPIIKAWLYVDAAQAQAQAREIDKRPPSSPIHGLAFGVKDVFDTCDLPTTQNSPLYQGHQPAKDAACVGVVRHSGAVILGKTDTVEFAGGGRKAATRNPYNLAHTPGGTSSGSAAAVADFQVPYAFGTQTSGSHIRPASFNGIYAMKPTWGAVSREGFKQLSVMLDTVGWYGRSAEDLAMVGEVFRLPGLSDSKPMTAKGLRIGVCRTPRWNKIETGGEKALKAAAQRLERAGATIEELILPESFAGLYDAQDTILQGEAAVAFLPDYLASGDRLHVEFRDKVEYKTGVTPKAMAEAYDLAGACRPAFDRIAVNFDCVLTPSAPGEAPEGLGWTGDWVFNIMWTLLHVPCVAIPCTVGQKGLPVGIQIIGPRFGDGRLLRAAAAVAAAIDVEERPPRV